MIDDDLFDLGPPPAVRERREPEPVEAFVAAAPAAGARALKADNDPLVGAPRHDRAQRDARELQTELQDAYREPVSGPFARDPFEHGRFAHERRAMLAAVMGGRR